MDHGFVVEEADDGTAIRFPRTFRSYRYVKTLGSGLSSVVCLVTDSRTKQFSAAKVISRETFNDAGRLQHCESELRLMSSIHHPSIVELRDIVYLEEVLIMIFEYCERGDVLDYIYKNGMPEPDEVKRWLQQLLSGLQYLHSRGVAHRDLKPENLLLDRDLNLKIGDFGLARETRAGRLMETPVGTPCYTAPEILRRENYDGARADIWSVGVITWVIALGTLPWRSIGDVGLRREIIEGQFSLPEELDPDIKEFIEACMVPEPKKRATAAHLLTLPIVANVSRLERRHRPDEVKASFRKRGHSIPSVQSQRVSRGRYFVPHGAGVRRMLQATPSVRCL